MKDKRVLVVIAAWIATSAAIIAGIIVTKDLLCLFGLAIPAFITMMIDS